MITNASLAYMDVGDGSICLLQADNLLKYDRQK